MAPPEKNIVWTRGDGPHDLLIRIDERVESMQQDIGDIKTFIATHPQTCQTRADVEAMKQTVSETRATIGVYTAYFRIIGGIATLVVAAVIGLVIKVFTGKGGSP